MTRAWHAFGSLRLYAEVARLSFRRHSIYRGAMIAGLITNFVFGLIRAGVLRTSIGSSNVNGLTAESATAFVFISQALIAVTSLFGDYALVGLVKSGDVATELHRPWDWSLYRLGNDLGKSAFAGITRGLAIAVGGWLMFALPAPELRRVLMFLITVVLAAVLASRIWTISGIAAFWLVDATGVVQLFVAFAMFTTGLVVPLQILPDALGAAFGSSPFASLIQRPTEVLLGQRSLAPVVAVQLAWIALFEVVLRLELLAANRRLEVQGG